MKVNQDQFIVAVLGLGLFFFWIFNRGRSRTLQDDTTPLNLKKSLEQKTVERESFEVVVLDSLTQKAKNQVEGKARSLNIMFNYNGHTFDAYEVLGVPGGANLAQVTQAYQKSKKKSEFVSNKSSRDIVDLAYEVLKRELQKTS